MNFQRTLGWVGGLGVVMVVAAGCQCKSSLPPPEPIPPRITVSPPPPSMTPVGDSGSGLNDVAPTADATDGGSSEVVGTAGETGTVEGEVVLATVLSEPPMLKRSSDPLCGRTPMKDETVSGREGKLENVVVRVMGLPSSAPPASAVRVRQVDCMYRPRVQGAVKGQSLEILNDDKTLHNVHTYEGAKTLFNRAQPARTAPIQESVNVADVLRMKCDVHPWMTGYIVYADNSFFAVSDADGRFKIPNVPRGTYTAEAWHESLGVKTAQIHVEPGSPAQVFFTY